MEVDCRCGETGC